MTDEDFRKLCNVYGFAPSRALREMLDCAVGQAAVKELELEPQGPTPPYEAKTEAEKIAYCAGWWAALEKARGSEERNFCPRCGKRTNDIHTCTPPDLRAAAQQALEAMELIEEADTAGATPKMVAVARVMYAPTITALKAALAEHDKKIVWVEERKAHWAEQLQLARENQERERQQREEAALAEPVQEPVAWMVYTLDGKSVCVTDNPVDFTEQHKALPLYTAPPQRKPLTDEEILRIKPVRPDLVDFRSGVRCAERAHGIKDA